MQRFVVYFSFFFICLSPVYSEPLNLDLIKKIAIEYHDSGRYDQEMEQKIAQAQRYIIEQATANAQRPQPKKLAIVLDIDETSISNYAHLVKRGFANIYEQINEDILAADDPVIAPTLALYQEVLKHGVSVFFVTGRTQSQQEATQRNLIEAGYTQWSGLYLRPDTYTENSIIPFKSQTRANITNQGYTIVASIGDQYSDVLGGYSQRGFKLPNPYYFLP